MARQPKDETSLEARLKSAKLLMRPNVSNKLSVDDLKALASFITEAKTLLTQLGKELDITVKQTSVNTNYSNNTNQSYNSNYNTGNIPYQLQGNTSNINTVVNGSGTVPGYDGALGIGSLGAVSAYNPELDFINNSQPLDMPVIVPTPEQLEAEARLLNGFFEVPEDIVVIEQINEVT